jgi:hypothetical protein
MKKGFTFTLLAAIVAASACKSPTKDPVEEREHCKCIFLRPGNEYLLSGVRIVDETTNTSREAMERWKEFTSKSSIEIAPQEKELRVEGDFALPYFDSKGVKYYKTVHLDKSRSMDDFGRFFTMYCIKFELYSDPATCAIMPEHLESMRREIERLEILYLQSEKPGPENGVSTSKPLEGKPHTVRLEARKTEPISTPVALMSPPPASKDEISKWVDTGKAAQIEQVYSKAAEASLSGNDSLILSHSRQAARLLIQFLEEDPHDSGLNKAAAVLTQGINGKKLFLNEKAAFHTQKIAAALKTAPSKSVVEDIVRRYEIAISSMEELLAIEKNTGKRNKIKEMIRDMKNELSLFTNH